MGRTALFSRHQPGGVFVIDDLGEHPGDIWFVDSATGTDGAGYGKSPDSPVATLDYAIGLATANKSDTIYVMPGHAETIAAAAGIDADVAGIRIIGLGDGEKRPTFTFATAVGADMDVDAANITVKNILFKNDIDSQTAMIDVNAKDFTMEDCELREGTAKQALIYIDVGGGANGADGAVFRRVRIAAITAGADSGIKLAAVQDRVVIDGCIIDGDFSDAGIHNPTGQVCTNLLIKNNIVRNRQTTDHAIELVSACTGEAVNNWLFADTATSVFDPGSLFVANNHVATAIDQESASIIALWPAAAAAGNGASVPAVLRYIEDALVGSAGIVTFPSAAVPANAVNFAEVIRDIWAALQGTATGENGVQTYPAAAVPGNNVSLAEVLRDVWDAVRNGSGGSEPGANKSLVDAIGFDGVAAVAASAGMLRVANGTTFTVKKALTSSAVVQAGIDVTTVSTVGDIMIDEVMVQADGTGLAAGTSFTLEANNAKGSAVFFSTAVSGLGANAVMSTEEASVVGKKVVLESGKKIVAKCTVADCTGAGTVDVYLLCRRLADNATLVAA